MKSISHNQQVKLSEGFLLKDNVSGSILATEEDLESGKTSDVLQAGTEYDDDNQSYVNEIAYQSDYFLAGRKRMSVFKAIPAPLRYQHQTIIKDIIKN